MNRIVIHHREMEYTASNTEFMYGEVISYHPSSITKTAPQFAFVSVIMPPPKASKNASTVHKSYDLRTHGIPPISKSFLGDMHAHHSRYVINIKREISIGDVSGNNTSFCIPLRGNSGNSGTYVTHLPPNRYYEARLIVTILPAPLTIPRPISRNNSLSLYWHNNSLSLFLPMPIINTGFYKQMCIMVRAIIHVQMAGEVDIATQIVDYAQ